MDFSSAATRRWNVLLFRSFSSIRRFASVIALVVIPPIASPISRPLNRPRLCRANSHSATCRASRCVDILEHILAVVAAVGDVVPQFCILEAKRSCHDHTILQQPITVHIQVLTLAS